MFHEDICTVNISKLNFWLVICIAKNFIWTTLKAIFSIFWFFCTLRFQIFQILSYHNKPYINGKIIYSAFRWCINLNFTKCTLMTGFVLQGLIYYINTNVYSECSPHAMCLDAPQLWYGVSSGGWWYLYPEARDGVWAAREPRVRVRRRRVGGVSLRSGHRLRGHQEETPRHGEGERPAAPESQAAGGQGLSHCQALWWRKNLH